MRSYNTDVKGKWFLFYARTKSVRFRWDGKVYSAFDTKEDAEAHLVGLVLCGSVETDGWVVMRYDELPYAAAAMLSRKMTWRNAVAKKMVEA